jgi:toxin YoeB
MGVLTFTDTLQDRLLYRVTGTPPDQALEILQRRFHY